MKVLKTSAICALLALCFLHASAQEKIQVKEPDYNKPHLFDDLPQKMKLRVSDFANLLNLPVGASVKTFLADNFHFKGVVVSASGDETVKSVVIRSTDRIGATLTVTKTYKEDGTARYLGRILSLKNGDAFEIVKENDQYVMQKKNLYDIISE